MRIVSMFTFHIVYNTISNRVINRLGYEIMHGNSLIIYTLYDYHWAIYNRLGDADFWNRLYKMVQSKTGYINACHSVSGHLELL